MRRSELAGSGAGWRTAAAVLVACAAVGCDEEAGTELSLADYLSMAQQLDCRKALECCTDHEVGEHYNRPLSDIQTCADIPQDVSGAVRVLYQPSLDSGRALFDSVRARACVDAYESLTCAQYAATSGAAPCESPLVPQQDPGEPCNQGFECTTGYCAGGSLTSEGSCATLPGSGATCDLSCAAGFYCDISDTCVAVLADGVECFHDEDCANGWCFTPVGGSDDLCGVMCDGR